MVRLLEVSSGSKAVAYGGAVLAALGHDVWKIELGPSGDELRMQSPSAGESSVSVAIAHTSLGKRQDWLADLSLKDCISIIEGDNRSLKDDAPSRSKFAEALDWAEVIVTSYPEMAEALRNRFSVVSVTPFGLGSPKNSWQISGTTLFHMSGLGIVSPRSAYHGETQVCPPQAPWGSPLEYLCGAYVAFSALGLSRLAVGSLADVSLLDCLLPLTRRETAAWQYDGFRASRSERLWKVGPSGFYECADGYVYLHVVEDNQWRLLCQTIASPGLIDNPRFKDAAKRFAHEDEIDLILNPWCKVRPRIEVFEIWGAAGIPCGPAFTVAEARSFEEVIDIRTSQPDGPSWSSPLPIRFIGENLEWLGQPNLSAVLGALPEIVNVTASSPVELGDVGQSIGADLAHGRTHG